MVSTTGDIPDREEVMCDGPSLVEDVLESGECTVELRNGREVELHKYDTYVFGTDGDCCPSHCGCDPNDGGYVYTKLGDDDFWFVLSDVVGVTRHYDG